MIIMINFNKILFFILVISLINLINYFYFEINYIFFNILIEFNKFYYLEFKLINYQFLWWNLNISLLFYFQKYPFILFFDYIMINTLTIYNNFSSFIIFANLFCLYHSYNLYTFLLFFYFVIRYYEFFIYNIFIISNFLVFFFV